MVFILNSRIPRSWIRFLEFRFYTFRCRCLRFIMRRRSDCFGNQIVLQSFCILFVNFIYLTSKEWVWDERCWPYFILAISDKNLGGEWKAANLLACCIYNLTPSDPENIQLLKKEVESLLEKQAIEPVSSLHRKKGYYSRLFLVCKKSGGWRQVIDHSRLNCHLSLFTSKWNIWTQWAISPGLDLCVLSHPYSLQVKEIFVFPFHGENISVSSSTVQAFPGSFGGWSGGAKVLCILHHWGVQLILAYSWARPAILVVGKGRGGMFLFLLFLHFHSCSSFFPVPLFHLLYSLFYLFSPFLWETTQNDPQGLTCR